MIGTLFSQTQLASGALQYIHDAFQLNVIVTTLPGQGTLTLNDVPVTAGQSISAADINAGRLVWTPVAGQGGSDYASLTFQVQDDGGTTNGVIDTDPTPNTAIFHVNLAPLVVSAIPDQADDDSDLVLLTGEVSYHFELTSPATVPGLTSDDFVIMIEDVDVSAAFSDPDTSDLLAFSDGGTLPPGLSIDSQTGLISGTLDSSVHGWPLPRDDHGTRSAVESIR